MNSRSDTPSASASRRIATTAFADQRPGTSGLRKKTRVFMQPHYVENFVQAVLDAACEAPGTDLARTALAIGGDGRYYNRSAIQRILRVAVGNGCGRVLLARNGLLSTPAMSAVIRAHGLLGGLILSASHNPGGADADFGIKFNGRNGGPAPEELTERIYRRTLQITEYRSADFPEVDLGQDAEYSIGGTHVVVFDPLADYVVLLEKLFDFDALRALLRGKFRLRFDAMHGITGPYAHHIFEHLLGAAPGTVVRGTPLEDFGGLHPDPNLVHAAALVAQMNAEDAPDLGAACDGDGDRNLILGPRRFVSPGDSVAIIAEHAPRAIPGYRRGLAGVARSMPTSTALDRVAQALGVPCYETPTGWKFFGNLLDAGLCTICGEESFGTGSDHLREKDGLWAVLCWLSMLAEERRSVAQLVDAHWQRFGRSYYARHDYEALDADAAGGMLAALAARLPRLAGTTLGGARVAQADDFAYRDPVTGEHSAHGGLRILLEDGARVVCRLSGTGTEGATLRLYLERYRRDGGRGDAQQVLGELAVAATGLLELRARCGREQPSVVT